MIKEAYCYFEAARLLKEDGLEVAPTHQMAMAWLRKMHKIDIDIETCYEFTNKNEDYKVTGYEFTIHSAHDPCYEGKKRYDSYEKAVEAAIEYSLENLI